MLDATSPPDLPEFTLTPDLNQSMTLCCVSDLCLAIRRLDFCQAHSGQMRTGTAKLMKVLHNNLGSSAEMLLAAAYSGLPVGVPDVEPHLCVWSLFSAFTINVFNNETQKCSSTWHLH
jgi:hypothetical protein